MVEKKQKQVLVDGNGKPCLTFGEFFLLAIKTFRDIQYSKGLRLPDSKVTAAYKTHYVNLGDKLPPMTDVTQKLKEQGKLIILPANIKSKSTGKVFKGVRIYDPKEAPDKDYTSPKSGVDALAKMGL